MAFIDAVEGENGPASLGCGALGQADQLGAGHALGRPRPQVVQVAARGMVGLLAFAARGHEVARDHRHVALARRACADVALVAGVAERAHGLLRDADTQTALSFQHVALDVLERHALQASDKGEGEVLRAGVGQGMVPDLVPAAGGGAPRRQHLAPHGLVAVARRVEVERGL